MRNSIAIVGIGGVFPGATDLDSFWEMIRGGGHAAREVPPGRWIIDPAQAFSEQVSADKVNSVRGCFIDDLPFDPIGLNLDSTTLAGLDPAFHLLLHAGSQAWQDAATSQLDRKRVGVVIGNIVLPTDAASALADEILGPAFESKLLGQAMAEKKDTLRLNRYVAGLPAGVLAKGLQLGGGSYTLDAACASSLYALKYAAEELLSGRVDAMLAGGLSRPDCLYTQMGFSQLQAISKSGRCAPFDHKGDGLVVGEGAGIVVLKRLQDALDQGDHIYATIAGIGLSNDVGGNLMAPDSEGQQRAMLAAYQQAGWSPADVDLIECHGTGTPVGDAVEFNSLQSLWQDQDQEQEQHDQRCVIGSVKSNIGHLLTAAGAAGLIKVLLAMKHRQLPPTANFERAASGLEFDESPFEVLVETRVWPRRKVETPRRAALSAFGFGGINAHVLLQEWHEAEARPTVQENPETPTIAVVGIEAQFGPWRCLDQFRQRVFGFDDNHHACTPKHWWGVEAKNSNKGFFINEVAIPLGKYRIPPAELSEMLPQQLLMLQVASAALEDAGIDGSEASGQVNTGVYIGIGLDLNTTNYHFRWSMLNRAREWNKWLELNLSDADLASWTGELRDAAGPALSANRTMGALGGIVASRIARAFHIGGPSFSVSGEEASGLRALESGLRALQRGEIDTAVVGAVDLAGEVRASLGQSEDRPLSADMPIGEGATALVLKRHQDALRDGDRVYALIEGVGAATEGGVEQLLPTQDAYQVSFQRACDDAGVRLDSIGLIERHGSGIAAEEAMETQALTELLATGQRALPCALASIKSSLGHCGAAGGLAAVARASLSLYHQTLPPRGALDQAKYWLHDQDGSPRRAAVASFSIDGNCVHAILAAADTQASADPSTTRNTLPAALFALTAGSDEELLTQLQQLQTQLQPTDDIHQIAHNWWQSQQNSVATCSQLSLLCNDVATLSKQIDLAIKAVLDKQAIATNGVFYSIEPISQKGKIAFVYPGSGNHFHNMGRELALQWPEVLDRLSRENDSLGSQFARGRFWQDNAATDLDHQAIIFGQVWIGTLVSDIVAQFGLKPDAVVGYSLGETAGLFSTRTWTDRDEMLRRMQTTDLFTEQLAGPCHAVRQSWGLEEGESVDWLIGMVAVSAKRVRAALKGKKRAYLLIVNTPQECVIGGDRSTILGLAKELGCVFHPIQGVTTVHCDVAKPVQRPYRDLHLFETTPPADVSFYSCVWGRSYTVDSDSCADSIQQQALQSFDYTKVIESAYADGARIFIEMGPGASCTRMIGQILGQRVHLAMAICVPNQDNVLNLLELLARLHAEGLALDLAPLFSTCPAPVQSIEAGAQIVVTSGGQPFEVSLPSSASRPTENDTFTPRTPEVAAETGAMNDLTTDLVTPLLQQMQTTELAKASTQEVFLRVSSGLTESLAQALSMQMSLLQSGVLPVSKPVNEEPFAPATVAFDRSQCMEFAIGSIGKVLGAAYADVDSHPSRVRLPDEPLMLVDRILTIEGERDSMGPGRVTTEHDVLAGAWYLDGDRIPTCIAVEAGQADLFLCAYLGIDHQTRGQAVYRLLDAKITFHGPLPRPGDTIHYDIRIDHFFRQDQTWLFRFGFEGTVNGQPLLTMTDGCAGFFSQAELDAGKGIVETSLDRQPVPGKMPADWLALVPMQKEAYDDEQITALAGGDLQACFGSAFANIGLRNAVGLPSGRMKLVHRILELDPNGGRFGIGQIIGEADIQPDDWFLTCHFSDDPVMPGTLMYECCLHTLRIYLMRMGWVGEVGEMVCEPVQGVASELKCRGQVLAGTQRVQYQITLSEIGYQDNGTPFVLANALMSADGRAIVQINNMSVQLSGLTRAGLESLWANRNNAAPPGEPLFDFDSIYAFARGKPSEAFGDHYQVFDQQRVIARLPGPPYQFLDRIVAIRNCQQWVLAAGGEVVAEYDVPANGWYFEQDRQQRMPFAILLEVALQPCGWLAAYLGSALTSDIDLSFRNLGGKGKQSMAVTSDTGTLTTRTRITSVSQSGGMIIQGYNLEVSCDAGMIYQGTTTFGFFSKQSLAEQVGIRDAQLWQVSEQEQLRGQSFSYPQVAPYPDQMMRMVHEVELYDPEGGQHGLGFIRGTAKVDPEAWFFKAHFYQDPVWPGSLGLESLIQLLKVVALQRWHDHFDGDKAEFEVMALGHEHSWVYRGQIIPTDQQVTVEATILAFDDNTMTLQAEGFLSVDGRIIYQMSNFALKMVTK